MIAIQLQLTIMQMELVNLYKYLIKNNFQYFIILFYH